MPIVPPTTHRLREPWLATWTMLVDMPRASAIASEAAMTMTRDPAGYAFPDHKIPVACTYFDRGLDAPPPPERYRIRRLGFASKVTFENKRLQEGRIVLRSGEVDGDEARRLLAQAPAEARVEGVASRIAAELRTLELGPHFEVTYTREVFRLESLCAELFIDRSICLRPAASNLPGMQPGGVPLGTSAVVTMRFLDHPPALFRRLMQSWHLIPRSYSKYGAGREATRLKSA